MLTRAERAEFEARGLVRLRGAADAAATESLRARIVAYLAERGRGPDSAAADARVTPSVTSPLMKRVAFEELWGERVPAAIDAVLGAGRWQRPADAGQLLTVTPPEPGAEWHLPHKMWHLDYPAPAAARGPRGLQLFLCLDRVEPRAGGTLVAAGSHRLVDALRRRRPERWPGRSADVRESLRREVEWLRALWTLRPGEDRVARFLEKPAAEAGVELQVLELTGEPGDVILMHPWILHSLSANCGTRRRMVVTVRIQTLAC